MKGGTEGPEKHTGTPLEPAHHLFILLKTQQFEIRTPLTRRYCLLDEIQGTASKQLEGEDVTQSLAGSPGRQWQRTLHQDLLKHRSLPRPTLQARDALMRFTYDSYFSPDVKHSIAHHATKKAGALLVRAGFSKSKRKIRSVIARSCQEQGVTAGGGQRAPFAGFPPQRMSIKSAAKRAGAGAP